MKSNKDSLNEEMLLIYFFMVIKMICDDNIKQVLIIVHNIG